MSHPTPATEAVQPLSAELAARAGVDAAAWNSRWDGTTTRPKVAEIVALLLVDHGVEKVFGIPGIHNMDLWSALGEAGIDLVLVRHEQTAHYAADGYFRATGRLGVCLTTSGPGAANTAAATGEALTSGSGVLHITTSTPLSLRDPDPTVRRGTVHELPFQHRIFEPLVRTAIAVGHADEALPSALRVIADATTGWPAPTYLEFPADMLGHDVDPRDLHIDAAQAAAPATTLLQELPRDVVDLLNACENPVIWAGAGTMDADVTALAEHLSAPVVTTLMGRSTIDSDHPLAVANPPHEPAVADLIEAADVVLAIGTDWDGQNTQQWRLTPSGTVLRVDFVERQLTINMTPHIGLHCEAQVFIDLVIAGVADRPGARGAAQDAVIEVRQAVLARLAADDRDVAGARAVATLSAAIPTDCPVVADMTMVGYWASGYLRRARPRTFMYPMGWGTLGYGLPLSIGVAHASSEPTIAVVGDAGFLFGAGELATIAERQLPVVVVVFNDEAYGVLAYNLSERDAEQMRGLCTPDFVALAKSFGIDAVRVDADGLEVALGAAIARRAPMLIEVPNVDDPPVSIIARWPLKARDAAQATS